MAVNAKNRKSLLIILMLMFSALTFSNFATQKTVNAVFLSLKPGDALLYNVDGNHIGWENTSLWLDNPNYEYPYTHIYHWEDQENEVQSYTINESYTDYCYVDHVTSNYPSSSYWYEEGYSYDYDTDSWFLDWSYSDSYTNTWNWSDYFYAEYYNVYDQLLNLDILGQYYHTYHVETFEENYTINGQLISLNISHYRYEEIWSASWTSWEFYDLEVNVEETGTYITDYFIDNDTGTLIEAATYNFYDAHRWAYNYSADLDSYVEYDVYSYWEDSYEWNLFECNFDYNPVEDADLPYIIGGYQWITLNDNNTIIDIELEFYDSSNNMTLEVYLQEYEEFETWNLIDTVTNLTNGHYVYSLNTSELEYYGPYYCHDIMLFLYETNNPNHNSTWHISLEDNRIIMPDWPSWYEGSDYIVLGEWEEHWEEYQVYSDTWWTVEIYRLTDDPINPEEWWDYFDGYGNSSFWLHHPPEPAGTYEYKIVFWDTSGEYINMTVTVEVTGEAPPPDDTTPPTIEGEEPPIYVKKGESKTLDYKIYDENPGHVMVKQNDTVIIDEDMSSTEHHIYIDLSTLDIGVYIFSIDAWDAFDNHDVWDIEVHVTEDGQAPTDDTNNTDTNTLNLDAPNFLIIGLGILSLTSLAALVKKRR
ncbi:MAG: hypothetical protein ACTSQE_12675 [Candidatus Heimdallarchaeaceae archaeon]